MYIYKGELYLEKNHIKLLKKELEYVKQRYHAVASVLVPNSNVKRQKAAQSIGLSKRQFQRILKHFQMKGIPGLRHKSKRPNRSPNRTPLWLEDIIVRVREETGFGSFHISQIVNISLENRVKPRGLFLVRYLGYWLEEVLLNLKSVQRRIGNGLNGGIQIISSRWILPGLMVYHFSLWRMITHVKVGLYVLLIKKMILWYVV